MLNPSQKQNQTLLIVGFALIVMFPTLSFSWELQNKTLQERVQESPLIVRGEVSKVIEEKQSLFGGVGKEWTVQLHIKCVLKGELKQKSITVMFSDVKLDSQAIKLEKENIWFLNPSSNTALFLTKNFVSVYEMSADLLKKIEEYKLGK